MADAEPNEAVKQYRIDQAVANIQAQLKQESVKTQVAAARAESALKQTESGQRTQGHANDEPTS
jgi:hypothetical protein